MKQLTDAVAAQVMGELNILTLRIDRLNGEIQQKIEAFPEAATKEMNRAGDAAIEALAGRVAGIANTIAGDVAKAERNKSTIKVTQLHIGALVLSAIVFGGVGLFLGNGINSVRLSNAKELVSEANKSAGQAKVDAALEVEKIRAVSKWAGTPDGQFAKQFFDLGGKKAALCDSKSWIAKVAKDKTRWCVVGSEDQKDGWRIP